MKVVAGANQAITAWVSARLHEQGASTLPPGEPIAANSTALGVVDDQGKPVAGVVFHSYMPWFGSISMAVVAVRKDWLTRKIATEIMAYPFGQLKLNRVTVMTPSDPKASISRFLRKFGFVQEGRIRKGLGNDDAIIWGMLASEWKWSRFNLWRPVIRGQADTSSTRRSSRRGRRANTVQRSHGAATGATQ